MTYISALPTPPSRSDDPTGFSNKADALLAALPNFVTEANALSDEVDAMRDDAEAKRAATELLRDETSTLKGQAEAARDLAQTYRNTAGTYMGQAETARDQAQTAAAAAAAGAGLPSMVGKAGKQLVVAAGEGGVEWGQSIRRLPIFSAEAATLNPVSGGEVIGTYSGQTLSVHHIISTASMHIIAGNSNGRSANSPDGLVWTFRSTGLANIPRLAASPEGVVIGVNAAINTITRRSTDHGVTWSDGGALPASSYSDARLPAYANGVFLVKTGSGSTSAAARSTDGGITWEAVTLPLNTDQFTSIGGLFCVGTSSYYTSPDGVNWTSRTVPGGSWIIRYGNILTIFDNSTKVGYYSEDGINWEAIPVPLTNNNAAVTRINGRWLYPVNGELCTLHNGVSVKRVLPTSGSALYMSQNASETIIGQFNASDLTVFKHNDLPFAYFEG